ncbi:MAG: DUF1178 family protein [Acidiferrobacterales bacterium]
MIIYDLSCADGHKFEGWFKQPDDFADQLGNSLLSCPVCGSLNIRKLPTASHIKTGVSRESVNTSSEIHNDRSLTEAMQKLRTHIDENFVNVGPQFPEEARKMHYGESEEKQIRGTATSDEVRSLAEEGIDAFPLPGTNLDKNKLN